MRGFVGDLAGIQNFVDCPRADHFNSHGSDEREMAEAWLQRAYGMDAIDLDAADAAAEADDERRMDEEELVALLADFCNCGGNADDLIAKVHDLVDDQCTGQSVEGRQA